MIKPRTCNQCGAACVARPCPSGAYYLCDACVARLCDVLGLRTRDVLDALDTEEKTP